MMSEYKIKRKPVLSAHTKSARENSDRMEVPLAVVKMNETIQEQQYIKFYIVNVRQTNYVRRDISMLLPQAIF